MQDWTTCQIDNGNEISVPSEPTAEDLIRLFIFAFKGEAYFPGSAKRTCMDLAIEYMKRELKSDQSYEKHLIGKSTLTNIIFSLINNPPGLQGIQCELGHIGNKYVDAGWEAGLLELAGRAGIGCQLKADGSLARGEGPDSHSGAVE